MDYAFFWKKTVFQGLELWTMKHVEMESDLLSWDTKTLLRTNTECHRMRLVSRPELADDQMKVHSSAIKFFEKYGEGAGLDP